MVTDLAAYVTTIRLLVLFAMAILWIAVATPRSEPGIIAQADSLAANPGE